MSTPRNTMCIGKLADRLSSCITSQLPACGYFYGYGSIRGGASDAPSTDTATSKSAASTPPVLELLDILTHIKTVMSTKLPPLMLAVYKDMLTHTINKHNLNATMPTISGDLKEDIANQCDAMSKFSEKAEMFIQTTSKLVAEYIEFTSDIIQSSTQTVKDTSDNILNDPQMVPFNIADFAVGPSKYLTKLAPESMPSSQRVRYWKALLCLYAPPLVQYFVETEIKDITGLTDMLCKLNRAFTINSSIQTINQEREFANSSDVELRDIVAKFTVHQNYNLHNKFCGVAMLAAVCTHSQQMRIVKMLGPKNLQPLASINFRGYY
ncbi:hypothetical protein DL89DRAFT_280724 [Linderina pennispora]|uniref:Uncharacterized protein n=1 Tax=Linderina pennispora TaxID=61395 RepID=A0A1Y1WL37_9FUNG|nr:uncharacterized protein DL89DRAFT_280724 [Linderina pennispora]ORX74279.1 hypothetical protein DL89DRAFT_280724 [Linderina pennispora]